MSQQAPTQDHPKLLGEDDLALIHALQLRPRASWTELGRALGVDPVTVARRWARLSRRGDAWVGVSPGGRLCEQVCAAFVEIDCAAGSADDLARTLADQAHVLTIQRSTGSYDLLATVATSDLPAMSRYTLDHLPTLPGVRAVRAHLVTHLFTEGGRWRIAVLAPTQRARLADPSQPTAIGRGPHEITALDRAMLGHLAHDGRATYQSLATALARDASTVKRRVDQLLRLDLLRFRCDFARPLGGWPITVTVWARVPPEDLPRVGHALVPLPETRNCAAISGPRNLVVEASLHALSEVVRFESRVAAAHPRLEIVDRVVTLRHDKLLGRVLDPYGRTVRTVPPDIWSEPDAPAR